MCSTSTEMADNFQTIDNHLIGLRGHWWLQGAAKAPVLYDTPRNQLILGKLFFYVSDDNFYEVKFS